MHMHTLYTRAYAYTHMYRAGARAHRLLRLFLLHCNILRFLRDKPLKLNRIAVLQKVLQLVTLCNKIKFLRVKVLIFNCYKM